MIYVTMAAIAHRCDIREYELGNDSEKYEIGYVDQSKLA